MDVVGVVVVVALPIQPFNRRQTRWSPVTLQPPLPPLPMLLHFHCREGAFSLKSDSMMMNVVEANSGGEEREKED